MHPYAHMVQHSLDLPGVLLHPSGEDVRGRVELLLDDIDLLLDISWEEDLVDRDVLRRRQAAGEVPQVVHRQVALPEDVVDGPDGAPVEQIAAAVQDQTPTAGGIGSFWKGNEQDRQLIHARSFFSFMATFKGNMRG